MALYPSRRAGSGSLPCPGHCGTPLSASFAKGQIWEGARGSITAHRSLSSSRWLPMGCLQRGSPCQPTELINELIQLPQNKSPRTEHASWKVPSGRCSKSEEGSAYSQTGKINLMLKTKIEAFLSVECWGRLQWAEVVPKLPLLSRPGHKNVLQQPKIQGCFSAWVLHSTDVPQSSSKPEFTVCYHDIMKSNATGNGNRYLPPRWELQQSVPEGGGGRASPAEFYKIFYWQKSLNLKKHVFLI